MTIMTLTDRHFKTPAVITWNLQKRTYMHENLQKETSQKDVKHPIVSNSMLQDTSSLEFLHGFGIIGRTA